MPPSTIAPYRPSTHPLAAELSLGEFAEKVRQGVSSGAYQFEPWLDRYTEETPEIKAVYTRMLRHPVVKAALHGKINAVSSLDLTLPPASDQQRDQEIADFCHAAYTSEIEGGFLGCAETVLLSGLMTGTSITERVWSPEPKGRGKWRGKRFWRTWKDKEHVRLKVDEYRNVTAVCSTFGRSDEWPPEDFIIFRPWQLYKGPGMSDFRAAYAPWWRLTTLEKLRVIYLEKCAAGRFLKGSYTDDRDRPKLIDAMEQATARSWIVVPDSVKVELMSLAMGSESEFKSAIDSHKEDIALAISGAFLQMLTSGNQNPRGSSAVQKSTSELFIWALATKLCELLNRQATPYLVNENYIDADYPTASLGGINYAELQQSLLIDEGAQRMGFRLSRRAFAKKYALQEAADDTDVLAPAQPQQPQMPGAGGGGMPSFFADARKFAEFCMEGANRGKPGVCPDPSKQDQPTADNRGQAQPKPPVLEAEKQKFVGQTVGAAEHAHADSVSVGLAKSLGGKTEEETQDLGQKDKKPYDVQVPKPSGQGANDIEVKTLLKGEKQSISVHEDALLRKVQYAQSKPQNTFHTVVKDERATFGGGEFAANYSGHDLYYKRGNARYSLAEMYKVKDEAELKRLINTPDKDLPEAARGSLPPPPPLAELQQAAARASEARKTRDKARKERNKDKLLEQARARAKVA